MFVFGLGAALPLLGIGVASREAMQRWRTRILAAGQIMKMGLGVLSRPKHHPGACWLADATKTVIVPQVGRVSVYGDFNEPSLSLSKGSWRCFRAGLHYLPVRARVLILAGTWRSC